MATKPTLTFALLTVALATGACSGKHEQAVQNEEPAPQPVSVVNMGDAKAATQLLSGFYVVEANAWRWTSGKFAVLLATPAAAKQNGGTLTLNLTVPDPLIKKIPKVTLTASVNGMVVGSNTYAKTGPAVFMADVPKELLAADTVKIDFALDKDLAPNTIGDVRELGVIANSVGLASK